MMLIKQGTLAADNYAMLDPTTMASSFEGPIDIFFVDPGGWVQVNPKFSYNFWEKNQVGITIPYVEADAVGNTASTYFSNGLGDIRLNYKRELLKAKSPSRFINRVTVDGTIITPTGSPSNSVGSDSWFLAPSVRLTNGLLDDLYLYTSLREAHSVSRTGAQAIAQSNMVLPVIPGATQKNYIQALQLESMLEWRFFRRYSLAIAPNFMQDFGWDENQFMLHGAFSMKASDLTSFALTVGSRLGGSKSVDASFAMNVYFAF